MHAHLPHINMSHAQVLKHVRAVSIEPQKAPIGLLHVTNAGMGRFPPAQWPRAHAVVSGEYGRVRDGTGMFGEFSGKRPWAMVDCNSEIVYRHIP